MFRNNWIRVPLFAAIFWVAFQLLFSLINPYPSPGIWVLVVGGLVFGFSIQIFAWIRAKDKFGDDVQAKTETHQRRTVKVMQDKQQAFETCRRAIESLPNLKLRSVDAAQSTLKIRSKIHRVAWGFTWGNLISLELTQVGDHLTEVAIASKPFMPTVMVDSGEAWTTLEQLVSEIKNLDSEPSRASLNDGAELLRELTTRPVTFHR